MARSWLLFSALAASSNQKIQLTIKSVINFAKRRRITALCLILVWLALAGAGNAWVIMSGVMKNVPTIIGVIAIVYAITAGLSAVGLWKMQRWGISTLRSLMGACGLLLIAFALLYSDMVLGGYLGAALFGLFIASIFYLLDRYVIKKFSIST